MRIAYLSAVIFAALASTCLSQIKLASEYAVGQPVTAEVVFPDAPPDAIAHTIWALDGSGGYLPLDDRQIAIWPEFSAKPGILTVRCTGFLTLVNPSGNEIFVKGSHHEFEATAKLLAVGNPPPGPGPEPIPPAPDPSGPAPIPEPGFRVMFVYESSIPLSKEHVSAIYGIDTAQYLDAKCVKVNGRPQWIRIDPDTTVADDSAIWRKALTRPRASLPWVVISDGTRGFEGPLPATRAEIMDLLRRYGGQ